MKPSDFEHHVEMHETIKKLRAELSTIRDHFESELVRGVAQATKEKDAEIARLTRDRDTAIAEAPLFRLAKQRAAYFAQRVEELEADLAAARTVSSLVNVDVDDQLVVELRCGARKVTIYVDRERGVGDVLLVTDAPVIEDAPPEWDFRDLMRWLKAGA